jgi:hypothetical protein
MKNITKPDMFVFRCECGHLHSIEIPTHANVSVCVDDCPVKTVVAWDGEHFEVHGRRESLVWPVNREERLIRFLQRFALGGDLHRSSWMFQWWAKPLRWLLRLSVARWRYNCLKYGYRDLIGERPLLLDMSPVEYRSGCHTRGQLFDTSHPVFSDSDDWIEVTLSPFAVGLTENTWWEAPRSCTDNATGIAGAKNCTHEWICLDKDLNYRYSFCACGMIKRELRDGGTAQSLVSSMKGWRK